MGDWDGDGTRTPGVYLAGSFYLNNELDGSPPEISFAFGDRRGFPVVGDYDGDAGPADAGAFVFGTPNASYPVPGDCDADGDDTVGVETGTTWTLRNSNTLGPPEITFDFGGANDLPLTWWTTSSPAL